jgi:DNA-binding CsgD family transcriptional regulator
MKGVVCLNSARPRPPNEVVIRKPETRCQLSSVVAEFADTPAVTCLSGQKTGTIVREGTLNRYNDDYVLAECRTTTATVAALCRKIDESAFSDEVMSAIGQYVDVAHYSAFSNYPEGNAPYILAGSRGSSPVSSSIAKTYAANFYQHDTYAAKVSRTPGTPDILVHRRLAREVPDTRYRRECYEKFGIFERLTISLHEKGHWRSLNLYRDLSAPSFTKADISSAVRVAICILPTLPLREQLVGRGASGTTTLLARYSERLERLQKGLTSREIEVCARALMGMTVEATALDLKIGCTSVATYRKRAYARLNLSSTCELFSILSS